MQDVIQSAYNRRYALIFTCEWSKPTCISNMQIAKHAVRSIFTYDNMIDTSAILLRVMQTPEIRELTLVAGGPDRRQQGWQAAQAVIDNIKRYLTVSLHTKGSRTTENQRAYRTVVAACSGHNLVSQRKLSETGRLLVRYVIHTQYIHITYSISRCNIYFLTLPYTGSTLQKNFPWGTRQGDTRRAPRLGICGLFAQNIPK